MRFLFLCSCLLLVGCSSSGTVDNGSDTVVDTPVLENKDDSLDRFSYGIADEDALTDKNVIIDQSTRISDQENLPRTQLCAGSGCRTVEIAATDAQRAQGLMFVSSFPDDTGMLFVFADQQIRSFRMKNTLVPLDMVRIDADRNVAGITTATPCTLDPCPGYSVDIPSQYVLELNAGQAHLHNIVTDTRIVITN